MKKIVASVITIATVGDLGFALFTAFSKNNNYYGKPTTLYQFWLLLAIIGIIEWAARIMASGKPGIRFGYYLGFWAAGLMFSAVTMILPSPHDFIPLDYDGIVVGYRDLVSADDEIDLTVKREVVVRHDYPWTESEVLNMEDMNDRFSRRKTSFLFWQTGMVEGYEPLGIDSYIEPETFGEYIGVFFSVGPLVTLETCLMGIIDTSPFIIIALLILKWRTQKSFSELLDEEFA